MIPVRWKSILAGLSFGFAIVSGWLGAGCQSYRQANIAWQTLADCDTITNSFRGFHQDDFPASWTCDSGTLRSVADEGVDLITRETYEDFDLELDYRISEGAKGGILYGVSEATTASYWSGPEMTMNTEAKSDYGRNLEFFAGSLDSLLASKAGDHLKPAGEFNHLRILSRGGHVEHWLNGEKVVEYEWSGPELKRLIEVSKFKDASRFMKDRKGYIALRHRGGEVSFRDIHIRRL